VIQEDVNLVEAGFDGENVGAHVHITPHALIVDVELQVLGNLRAALSGFLRLVGNAGIATHVIFKAWGRVVDIAAIMIQNQSPDFVMRLHELGKLMHPLNAFQYAIELHSG